MHWSGDEWQDYSDQLFTVRHGEDYQRVPSTYGGDLGIEGFTASGNLYQCYSAEDILDRPSLYKHQRDKLTEDIGKLVANLEAIAALVAPSQICRWILMVPVFYSKDLLTHAAKKAFMVRARESEHVSESFDIRVLTADDYAVERHALGGTFNISAVVPVEVPTESEVAELLTASPTLFAALETKLAALTELTDSNRDALAIHFVNRRLSSQAALEELRKSYPTVHEEIIAIVRGREASLAVDNMLSQHDGHTRLTDLASTLESQVGGLSGGLGPELSGALAWGAIGDWLMRCPLDFKAVV